MQLYLTSFCLFCYFIYTCGADVDEVTADDATTRLESFANDETDGDEDLKDLDWKSSRSYHSCRRFCSRRRKNKPCSKLVSRYISPWVKVSAFRTCANCHYLRCPNSESTKIFGLDSDTVVADDATTRLERLVYDGTDGDGMDLKDFDGKSSKEYDVCKRYCSKRRKNKPCSKLVVRYKEPWVKSTALGTCTTCRYFQCPKSKSTKILDFESDEDTDDIATTWLESLMDGKAEEHRMTLNDFDADVSINKECRKFCRGRRKYKSCSKLVKGYKSAWQKSLAMTTCTNCHFLNCSQGESSKIIGLDQQNLNMK